MKQKIILLLIIFISLFGLTGCNKDSVSNTEEEATAFKESYESLNGEENSSGKEYRTVSIDSDNPYKIVDASEIIEMIENNDSFYVYFGSNMCPWCRSVIEKSIEVAKEKNIPVIYYVEIWGDDHEEILRDKYTLNDDNEPELESEGTDDYSTLLELLGDVLDDYTLTDDDGNSISVGEKRIYAPNFVYIKNGTAVDMIDGISEKQDDSYGELTDEILEEQEEIFKEFFS